MPFRFPDGNGGVTIVGADVDSIYYSAQHDTIAAQASSINVHNATIDGDPIFTGNPSFENAILPVASESIRGGIKIGYGLFMQDDTLNRSDSFDEQVSLKGGFRVASSLSNRLGNNDSLYATENYFKLTNSTIDTDNVLFYKGKHVFDDRVSIRGDFYTASSVTSDFGNHGLIKAQQATIDLRGSTIKGDYVTVTGSPTFEDKISVKGGIVAADSVNNDFGSHGNFRAIHKKMNFGHSTIDADRSEINFGSSTITGRVNATDKWIFEGNITLENDVVVKDDVTFNDSLEVDFGRQTFLNARQDTLDLRNSVVRFDGATIKGLDLPTGGGAESLVPTVSGETYTLPTASTSTKGGVKIGAGLSMNGETLNCTVSSGGLSSVILSTTPSTQEGAMWYVVI